MNIAKSKEGVKKEMLYKVKYKHRSARNPEKWTEFSEVRRLEELYNQLKWLEKNSDDHILISIEPYKG